MPTTPGQDLESRLARLEAKVDELQTRLTAYERQPAAKPAIRPPEPTPAPAVDEDVSEELLSWVGRSSLLPRISTLCFLLVVALALRTVTDHEILARTTGSYLGMLYAGTLIAGSWLLYRRDNPLAPVFAACGAVLMAVIVVEIHAHFQALPSIPAYIILLATGATMALLSYIYRVNLPIILGTLGMGVAGVAIDYPNPVYPLLAALLLAANALGFGATLLKRSSWLRWLVLLLTMTMMTAWALKLGIKIPKGETIGLYPAWYLPCVTAIFLFFTAAATAAIFERGALRTERFDLCLPLLNVLWVYPGAAFVIQAGNGLVGISLVGLLVSAGYFTLMWRIGNHAPGQQGVGAFATAGVALAAMALATLFGDPLLPLLALGASGVLLVRLADHWQHGALRLIAMLLQLGSGLLLSYQILAHDPPFGFLHSGLTAALLAGLAYAHYHRSSGYSPAQGTWFFHHYDPENRLTILLLLVTLLSTFFALRAATYATLSSLLGPQTHALASADSVIINIGATALMLYAYFREQKQIRNLAVLITLIGGSKVFLFDLFSISGFPLVISVLVFGLAIFFQSVAFSSRTPIDVSGRRRRGGPIT